MRESLDIKALARQALQDADDPNVRYPFYPIVPKGFHANLRFRRAVLELARGNPEIQAALRQMCARDLLFYVNTFCWTYVPSTTWLRNNPMRVRPFITWEYQDQVLAEVEDAIGDHDLLGEKSRDMGASWLFMLPMEHQWHFRPLRRFGLLSRNEKYVDDTENPKALFWKIDFLHRYQPRWLLPTGRALGPRDPNRKSLHLKNADNGSTIDGEATTGDCFRGDRLDAILLDEFASVDLADGYKADKATRDATPCRLYNSTPKGAGNAFYDRVQSDVRKVRMYWADHPIKRRGLYRGEKGRLKLIDRDYWTRRLLVEGIEFHPDDLEAAAQGVYAFTLEDEEFPLRSPWFDDEEKRCNSRAEMRQEVEIRYDAASTPFFDPQELAEHKREHATAPLARGVLDFNAETFSPSEFLERDGGLLRLWFRLDATGRPPAGDYVIGIDVATGGRDFAGRGASNSVAVVAERRTREQIAEYAVAGMRPDVFAERCYTLARWFRNSHGEGAKVIWEVNGPGVPFGDRMLELGYRNIYRRQSVTAMVKRRTLEPGWHSNVTTKRLLLSEFRRAIGPARELVIRSAELLDECQHYQEAPGGQIVHVAALNTEDPSGARDNHADRAIGGGLVWWEMRDSESERETEPEIPNCCFASRRREYERELNRVDTLAERKERARR